MALSYPTIFSLDLIKRIMTLTRAIVSTSNLDVKILAFGNFQQQIALGLKKYVSPKIKVDMLDVHPDERGYKYDLVFLQTEDVAQISQMYEWLKTNGRMIVLSPGAIKLVDGLILWLEEKDAYIEDLHEMGYAAVLMAVDNLEHTYIERSCRVCGCTQHDCRQCIEKTGSPCSWVEDDLCSACVDQESKVFSKTNNMHQITIPKAELQRALKKVKDIIPRKPVISALSNVLVRVKQAHEIEISATDLVVTIQATIAIESPAETDFKFLLPFNFFNDLVSVINSESITIETDGKQARISGFNDQYDIEKLEDVADYPQLPVFPSANMFEINSDFVHWLTKAAETVSVDTLRPAMCKVFMQVEKGLLTLASTDAHVLFTKAFAIDSKAKAKLLVSTTIVKALNGFNKTSIYWNETHVAFSSDNLVLIGTLQDEKYPAYKSVIPDYASNVTFNRLELVGAMEKVSLISGKEKSTTLRMKQEIGVLLITANDLDFERHISVRLPMDYEGPCDAIALNSKNILKLLGQVDFETVELAIHESNRPVLIRSESDDTYLGLAMPMTING